MRRASAVHSALLFTAACGGGAASTAPTPPAPAQAQVPGASRLASDYLNELVNTMQVNSINRGRINLVDFRAQVFQRAAGAQTIRDLYPAISLALGLLEDHHSFYQAAGGSGGIGNPSIPNCSAAPAAAPVLPADLGYVRVTAFSNAAPGADRAFADALQSQIRARDTPSLAGWIVDVRGNSGGNMWPMVAGVAPVLGDGVVGFFVAPTGTTSPWTIQGGSALNGSSEIVRTTTTYQLLAGRAPRVAVLTDNFVASSGEAVVVAFRERPNTRSFGMPTCGLSTANAGFALSDGAMLQLTTSLMADRRRTSYGFPIAPDEVIAGDMEVVLRAVDWLRSE